MWLYLVGALIVGGGAGALRLDVLAVRIAIALSKSVALCRTVCLRFYRLLVLWRGLVLIRARIVVIKIGRCHGWQGKDGNQS